MKAINFEQANIMLAESQEEYETLPIWMDVDENKRANMTLMADASGNLSMQPTDPMGQAVFCMQLSKEELDRAIANDGKIWIVQSTFWNAFQPIRMSTINPFEHA